MAVPWATRELCKTLVFILLLGLADGRLRSTRIFNPRETHSVCYLLSVSVTLFLMQQVCQTNEMRSSHV